MDFERQDAGLAFLQRYENVAWYESGAVRLLDRRVYPMKTEHVVCRTVEDVARAIRDMVTQSEGPYAAAAMGMALAAYHLERETDGETLKAALRDAAYTLSHARPTTSAQMEGIVSRSCGVLFDLIDRGERGEALTEAAFRSAVDYLNGNYARYAEIGRLLAEQIPDGGTILTQCFGGTVVGMILRACRAQNKTIRVLCSETRPYCQGARLTASVVRDMGFDVTVITDNMPAWAMAQLGVDLFTSASDVITLDGHVVNKVGTLQIALAAQHFGVPYYVTGTPDPKHADMSTVTIEQRDPNQVCELLGTRITLEGVQGWYPAFDVTPPELVTGVVTEKGIYRPTELGKYFAD